MMYLVDYLELSSVFRYLLDRENQRIIYPQHLWETIHNLYEYIYMHLSQCHDYNYGAYLSEIYKSKFEYLLLLTFSSYEIVKYENTLTKDTLS